MSQLPQIPGGQASVASRKFEAVSYRTNPNHPRHSKSAGMRLTLVMLWFLRAPLMVRTALIVLLIVPFLASSAHGARINAVREPAHASTAKGTSHRTHHATRAASHSSKTAARSTHSPKSRRLSRTTTHANASARSAASARRTPARHATHLRRTRYHRSGARFIPLATVPISRKRPLQKDSDSDTGAPALAETGSSVDPTEESLDQPKTPEATPAVEQLGQDEAPVNPLADPPAVDSAEPAATQIAALHVPRVYGRYALRGTHDSLVRQNERSEAESLERIEDDVDLENRIASGALVPVPETAGLMVNPALPDDRRYCRPWTANFLTDLSRAYEAQFHKPFVVSSAVRTVEYQKRLKRINHNAADAEGDIVSPHLTGATIDIAKSGLSRRQMQWMRDHLFAYQTAGVIDVEEEFRQRCFHITVYKNYVPANSVGKPHHEDVPQSVPPDPSTAKVSDSSSN